MPPTKFRFIWPSFFLANLTKGNMSFCHHLVSVVCHPFTFHILIFSPENQISTNQKQELPVVAMFVNRSGQNEQIYRGPSIDASYQVSVHLAKGFQKRRLKCEKLTDDKRGS
jgi:hypothetical protein